MRACSIKFPNYDDEIETFLDKINKEWKYRDDLIFKVKQI